MINSIKKAGKIDETPFLEIRIIAPDFSVTYSSDDDAYVAGLSCAMSGVLKLVTPKLSDSC